MSKMPPQRAHPLLEVCHHLLRYLHAALTLNFTGSRYE